MYSIKEIQEFVKKNINEIEFNKEPKGLYEPIKYILNIGGKRLRPVLCLMAYNLYSNDINKAIHPAIGVEVFHNFTLLHDDIMDNADMRRNHPTVHKKWDENTAILSGDAMMVEAYKQLLKYKGPNFREIFEVFTQTAGEVCDGQQYDMNFETSNNVSIDEYLLMIKNKTAVLLAGSLKIGALAADAPKEDAENLYNFGINIGMAFQLQDDYLDVFGDVEVFGKEIGNDISSNKKTFLLITALNTAKGEDKDMLNKALSNQFDKQEKIKIVTELYKKLKVDRLSKQKMDEYLTLAISYLDKVNVPKEQKKELADFAYYLSNRIN